MSSASQSSCVINWAVPRRRTQPFFRGNVEQIQCEYEPLLHAPRRQQAGGLTAIAARACHFAPNSHRPYLLADAQRCNRIRYRSEGHPTKHHAPCRDVDRTAGTAIGTDRSVSHESVELPFICARRVSSVPCPCQRTLRISPVGKTSGCEQAVPQRFCRGLSQKLSSLLSDGTERSSTTDETDVSECLPATGNRQVPKSDDEETSSVELTTPTSTSVRTHAIAEERLLFKSAGVRKTSTKLESSCTQCEAPTILKARRLDDISLGMNAGIAHDAAKRSSPDAELRGWDEDDLLSKLFIQVL
ncbi:hypothetical protein NCLIV_010470 [Neospora caninum Liverpool]|uniref:Uncharacterized protein n=1 Tax=Neospora caninum (strain Liverpool) TaxID=572307 RepID=F0VA89_NEOCL|nr:hypothetical protein NCLIV_010470 [Neospora caninum Liverpool]CBZ50578.1 hypothetical protein NCLIV_010470 [Neospora caninum Liverpool]CEL65191.1 TPA: hypothetical protein BN1204_010470 [Neospora caninum Liverpool]|eukprot:XP_003880611.1 hypothetical protein NCLIV_010470 [Neospora caninum Liverpool]